MGLARSCSSRGIFTARTDPSKYRCDVRDSRTCENATFAWITERLRCSWTVEAGFQVPPSGTRCPGPARTSMLGVLFILKRGQTFTCPKACGRCFTQRWWRIVMILTLTRQRGMKLERLHRFAFGVSLRMEPMFISQIAKQFIPSIF